MVDRLKVLFLSPEAVPFAKTGGLADVAGSLPAALRRLGTDVRLVLPLYRSVKEQDLETRLLVKNLEVPLGNERLKADLLETVTHDGVSVYLVEREDLYDRPNLYGNARGDYYDNLERFTFFSHAALRLTEVLSFRPHVIHCHDWQTGLVPALLKGPYSGVSSLSNTRSLFTIHNIGYQGVFPQEKLQVTGLRRAEFFHMEGLEYWDHISLLKAGIVYAEAITTVSSRYAEEIQTPECGMGMEGILRRRRASLHGILNGVDYRLWDPATDAHIPANYTPGELQGKVRCKEGLLREMGLDASLKSRPLLGMISRLEAQKGLDLLLKILEDLLAMDVGLVVLGQGDEKVQNTIQRAARRHPGRIGLFVGFNEPLAHRIMAGADILLIPSRYEPCGLTQMYALKYGTVPLVRATGGLDDTITPFDPETGEGDGFKFVHYEPSALLTAIQEAIRLYAKAGLWKRVMANAMSADFSWDRSAQSYLRLYRSVLETKAIQRAGSGGSQPSRVKTDK